MSSHEKILNKIKELKEAFEFLWSRHDTSVEQKLNLLHEQMEHIQRKLHHIEEQLDDPNSGLAEIKCEVFRLEHKLADLCCPRTDGNPEPTVMDSKGGTSVLTTGPVIRSDNVSNLYVKILNSTKTPQTVRISLFSLNRFPSDFGQQGPKQQADHRIVSIHSKHSSLETFDIGPDGLNLQEFEVEIEFLSGVTEGIFAFVAGAQGPGYKLNQSNVFRHQQLIRQVDP